MKYVVQTPTGVFDFSAYGDYLDAARATLAARIDNPELLAIERFIWLGRESFHDARFERMTIASDAAEPGKRWPTSVALRLKGPYFDRYFDLHYESVNNLELQCPSPEDDLIIHEIREEDGCVVHEFLFDGDKAVIIRCGAIRFRETVVPR